MYVFNDQLCSQLNWAKGGGLLPAVIQDHLSGQVLMLGYMNRQALILTGTTGQVTFYSRSKLRLWTKGETSGNTLQVVDIQTDCDQDTILIQATPQGPTCHTGAVSCFGEQSRSIDFLNKLQGIIDRRYQEAGVEPITSYTAKLFAAGNDRMAQKVGEEAVEVVIASKNAAATGTSQAIKEEAADLLYHLMVLLRANGTNLEEVVEILAQRHQKTVAIVETATVQMHESP